MNAPLILKFLRDIAKNNNREWFEKNKPVYLEAKSSFEDFLEDFHKELVKLDESLAGLNPRKMGFRIYRDVRFSKDKRPYKTNMGAGFSPNGKMEQEPGYYIHFEAGNKNMIAGGMYMPNPENLAKIRQEIDYNPKGILKILNDKEFKKYFKGLSDWDRVKTAPKGYPKDHPQIELLKNKSFTVSTTFTDSEVKDPKFLKKVATICKSIKKLNDYLKDAVA
ncbi:TIGR02453 family protein [Cytophagales bacterium WSM2-2]|nr:TIGR02453 family protein [Cytophagales bacterium WSM2-2]